MGIKCIEISQMKISEVKNGTIDGLINQKLNELIIKVNQLDEKLSTIKSNETNLISMIYNMKKDIYALKDGKIQSKLDTVNFTNTNEVKNLIEQMKNNTIDRQNNIVDNLMNKIYELKIKIDEIKVENREMHLERDQNSKRTAENLSSPMKRSEEKSSGITTAEFMLGILLAISMTLLIIVVAFKVKNYTRRNQIRMPRMSGRNTPNTIVTYDSQSVQNI
jgi:cell division protein FtsX